MTFFRAAYGQIIQTHCARVDVGIVSWHTSSERRLIRVVYVAVCCTQLACSRFANAPPELNEVEVSSLCSFCCAILSRRQTRIHRVQTPHTSARGGPTHVYQTMRFSAEQRLSKTSGLSFTSDVSSSVLYGRNLRRGAGKYGALNYVTSFWPQRVAHKAQGAKTTASAARRHLLRGYVSYSGEIANDH